MVDLVRNRLDKNKLKDGVWKNIPDFGEVRVRKWRNKDHVGELERLNDQVREELGLSSNDELPEEATNRIMVESTCKHVIVDWRGITENGADVIYTPEKGIEVFSDEGWSDIFMLIVNASLERASYISGKHEEAVKNA